MKSILIKSIALSALFVFATSNSFAQTQKKVSKKELNKISEKAPQKESRIVSTKPVEVSKAKKEVVKPAKLNGQGHVVAQPKKRVVTKTEVSKKQNATKQVEKPKKVYKKATTNKEPSISKKR